MTLLKGRTFIVLVLLVIFFTIVKGTTFLSASTLTIMNLAKIQFLMPKTERFMNGIFKTKPWRTLLFQDRHWAICPPSAMVEENLPAI